MILTRVPEGGERSALLLRRQVQGYSSPVAQRRSLEVASPQVPNIYTTNSLQRRRLQPHSQAQHHQAHHSPQLNRRSVPLEQGSPYLQRRLTMDRSSSAVLASLDKSILQIRCEKPVLGSCVCLRRIIGISLILSWRPLPSNDHNMDSSH